MLMRYRIYWLHLKKGNTLWGNQARIVITPATFQASEKLAYKSLATMWKVEIFCSALVLTVSIPDNMEALGYI